MTPSQEADKIIGEFVQLSLTYEESLDCAILHVHKTIQLLDKNSGYTQCMIDKEHYQAVLVELQGR